MAIVVRLAYLQIYKGSLYEAMSLGQQSSDETSTIKRGEIFLKNGEICLAQTKSKTNLCFSSKKISPFELEKEADFLAGFWGGTEEELLADIQNGGLIKKEIPDSELDDLKKYLKEKNLAGVWLEETSTRFYPQGSFTSQLLGFVNNEGQGQYGLESYYNDVLNGQDQQRTAEGEVIEQGANIYLTIDYNIQYLAEKLLKEANEKWAIDSGQIVVSEPATGKIIALANFPSFDCNNYGQESDLGVFVDSVTEKLFEPGSVFKPFTMAAGLEEQLVTPETKYTDNGFVNVGGKDIYNFDKRVWGEQMMIDVLEESINTGAVFVEQKIGSELFWRYIKNFGFLEKTDVDLPGEIFSVNKTLKNGKERGYASASFGQGIEITAIQLIRSFGALANNGKMMRPYVVEKIVKSNGQTIVTQPKFEKQVISEQTAAKLTAMLISVVKNGSGRLAGVSGYYIAGKTGTAQVAVKGGYSDDKTIHSFIGYFPALNPKYLILVKLDNPKGITSSGHSATPIFQSLAKYIIDVQQIPPSPDAP